MPNKDLMWRGLIVWVVIFLSLCVIAVFDSSIRSALLYFVAMIVAFVISATLMIFWGAYQETRKVRRKKQLKESQRLERTIKESDEAPKAKETSDAKI